MTPCWKKMAYLPLQFQNAKAKADNSSNTNKNSSRGEDPTRNNFLAGGHPQMNLSWGGAGENSSPAKP